MRTGHAVVIGAGIGGLLAARALSDTYQEVTVIDRDDLPDRPQSRRSVPQGRHVHGLLARGASILERYFPGFLDELAAAGVPVGDAQNSVSWYIDGRELRRAESELRGICVSRPMLEHSIRTRVARRPGVSIISSCEVTGLRTDPRGTTVTGVLAVRPDGPTGPIAADLVVDATGIGTRSPRWLMKLGYVPAPEDSLTPDITYVGQVFARPAGLLDGRLGTSHTAYPGMPRAAFALAQEGNRVIVSVTGWMGLQPPMELAERAKFVAEMGAHEVAQLMTTARPLTEPARMRYRSTRRRHYEKLDRLPSGFVVLGDALCSFNPIYGQGMTVAALQAELLGRLAAEQSPNLTKDYFAAAAQIVDTPWLLADGNDRRMLGTPGRTGPATRLMASYLRAVRAAGTDDAAVAGAFLRVTNLVDEPSALLSPGIVRRVLKARFGARAPESGSHIRRVSVADRLGTFFH